MLRSLFATAVVSVEDPENAPELHPANARLIIDEVLLAMTNIFKHTDPALWKGSEHFSWCLRQLQACSFGTSDLHKGAKVVKYLFAAWSSLLAGIGPEGAQQYIEPIVQGFIWLSDSQKARTAFTEKNQKSAPGLSLLSAMAMDDEDEEDDDGDFEDDDNDHDDHYSSEDVEDDGDSEERDDGDDDDDDYCEVPYAYEVDDEDALASAMDALRDIGAPLLPHASKLIDAAMEGFNNVDDASTSVLFFH
jgi:hypothetical protein